MNYLHDNLHVACWCKLQSCMLLNPWEHHLCNLTSFHVEVMIRSLKHLHKIDVFNARTDLSLMPKIISIRYRVKEIHHDMLTRRTKRNQRKRERMFDQIIEYAIRFLLMMIKNLESFLAIGPKPCTTHTVPMCFKGESRIKNK